MRKLVLLALLMGIAAFGGGHARGAEEKQAEDPMVECAQTITNSLHSRPVRIQALARLSSYYAQKGDDEKAEEYFSRAKEFAEELPFTYRDSIWEQVSRMFQRVGKYGYALDAARLMGTQQKRMNAVSLVTESLVNLGSIDRAERAVQRLLAQAEEEERIPLKLSALLRQATLNVRKGDTEAVDMSYRRALKLAQENADMLNEGVELVLKNYVQDCPVENVITAASRFFRGAERGRKLHMVGEKCLEADKEKAARKAFEASIKALRDVGDPNERVFAQAELAEDHAKAERSEVSSRLVEDTAGGLEKMMDPVKKDQARRALAVARAWIGEVDKGLEIAKNIGGDYERSLAMIQVAGKLAEKGSIDRALGVAEAIPKEYERDKAYAEIASAVMHHHDREQGKTLLRDRIQRRALKATVLVNVTRTFSDKKEYEIALDAVGQIPSGMGSRDVAAEKVVEALIDDITKANAQKNVPLAERAIKYMGYQHRTWQPLLNLAGKCEDFGRYEDALKFLQQLYDSVRSPDYKIIALARRTRIYAKMGQSSRAQDILDRLIDRMEARQGGSRKWSVAQTVLTTLFASDASRGLAEKFMDRVDDPYVKSHAYMWKLQKAADSGELDAVAQEYVRQIVTHTENVRERMSQLSLILGTAGIMRENDLETKLDSASEASLKKIAQAAEEERIAAEERMAELKEREGTVKLAFFSQVGCSACAKVTPVVKAFNKERPDVNIKMYEVTVEGGDLLKGLGEYTGLPSEKIGRVPAIFSDQMGLVGMSIDPQTLKQLANSSTGKAPWKIEGVRSGASSLGFAAVIVGGLLDGINPCAFTVWIFLIAYLGYMRKSKKEMALAGLVFTGAVFITYLAIGLGLRSVLQLGGDLWIHFNTALQLLVAALVLVLAVLSFADGILASKGRAKESWLKLPDSLQSKIRQTISKKARLGLTVGGTLVLGALVAGIEFPCTGQVYISILSLLQSQPFRANALAWLILYNVCFVLPLLAVFVLTFYGLTSERLGQWFKQHMAKVKFGLSGFFVFLFVIMVLLLTGVLGGGEMEDMGQMMEARGQERAAPMRGRMPGGPGGPGAMRGPNSAGPRR